METCSGCGERIAPANFCSNCGASLTEYKAELLAAEQRQLTVLFCDLVGSTQLIERLNVDEYHELIKSYQQMVTTAVTPFDGHIAQYLGDAAVVYFGYPTAQEDDPKHAILASMAMLKGIEELNKTNKFPALSIRIGVHVGIVVVGNQGTGITKDDLAHGLSLNVAARLQEKAEPGSVVVSDALRGLVEGFFTYKALGTQSIKGVSKPMRLFAVTGVETYSRSKALAMRKPTPFIGRKQELIRLTALFDRTLEGQFCTAMIQGESGIGKSRLTRLVSDLGIEANAALTLCECSPLHTNTALYPVVELFNTLLFGLEKLVPSEQKLDIVRHFLKDRELDLTTSLPLLTSLLNIPYQPTTSLPSMGSELVREESLKLLLELICSAHTPHLIVFEDMQWADATTLELVHRLVRHESLDSTMLLINARSELVPPWAEDAINYAVKLERLSRNELSGLIKTVADKHELSQDVAELIMERSDGVPLFAEELTKTVVASLRLGQNTGHSQQVVPETLKASLMARLDRLASAKKVAQYASVLGRRFRYDHLLAIADVEESELIDGLNSLIESDLIYHAGLVQRTTYQFNHALIQVAAYESLLRSSRRELHANIVQQLELEFAELITTEPELLARHSELADMPAKAINYWLLAGRSAFSRSANIEAAAHLKAGRLLLAKLPEPAERAKQELKLLTVLGPALIASTGFASDEIGEVYERSRALCVNAAGNPDTFPVLAGSWSYFLVKGELEKSRAYAKEMLQLGKQADDDHFLIEAHYSLGNSMFWLGELEGARRHLETADGLYDPARHQHHVLLFGQDPGVTARCYLSLTYWMLGRPDDAWVALDSAFAAADQEDYPSNPAWPMAFKLFLLSHRREPVEALQAAEQLIDYALKEQRVDSLHLAITVRGWAIACAGMVDVGIAGMQKGIAAYSGSGSAVALPHFYALLSEVLIANDRLKDAEIELATGFNIAALNNESVADINLWSLRGKLADLSGDHEQALNACNRAVEIARATGAWGPGLRAALTLNRLSENKDTKTLAEFVSRFDPQTVTPDMHEATRLLQAQ
jgi:class 3 adenylate cyclase/tetratricopeptide (TPR) repeat protein